MLGAFLSSAAPLRRASTEGQVSYAFRRCVSLLMQCALFVAFTSRVRTKEHCCSQFFHCISCSIYCQKLREKKAFHLLQEEKDQSLPSHHTYITPAFFFQLNLNAHTFRHGLLELCSPYGELNQHLHKGWWILADRSNCSCQGKRWRIG